MITLLIIYCYNYRWKIYSGILHKILLQSLLLYCYLCTFVYYELINIHIHTLHKYPGTSGNSASDILLMMERWMIEEDLLCTT